VAALAAAAGLLLIAVSLYMQKGLFGLAEVDRRRARPQG
jgi:hypothetical protein